MSDKAVFLFFSLRAQSTDDKWVPTVVRETATVIYKVRRSEGGGGMG